MEKIICKICGKEFDKNNALTLHLKKEHNISRKEYFDTYLEPYFHKCPYCNKERLWNLTNYRVTCGSKECKQKNFETVCLKKYGSKNPSSNQDVKEKKKQTKFERYGDENYNNREKCKQTTFDHYGVEYPLQSHIVDKKRMETCLEKYGTEYGFQSDSVKQKIKETCLEKYGTEYANQSDIVRQKMKETCLEKYGTEYANQSDIVKQKIKETCLEKYGVENAGGTKESQIKIKKTKLERYGDENYCNIDKIKSTCLERYGETSYAKTHEFAQLKRHKIYKDDIGFDSQFEMEFYQYCIDNNINIDVYPEPIKYIDENHIEHFYHPDFLINGDLYECKGKHFLIYDENGNIIGLKNPFTSKLTEPELLKDKCKQEAKFKCMVEHNVTIITDSTEFIKVRKNNN